MRRAYVVVGELEDGRVDVYYGITHTMTRADELCLQAEAEDSNPDRYYTWHEVIEDEEENI